MRKLKLVIIGALVMLTALFVVFIGCENAAPDPTQEDLDKLGAAMGIAFGELEDFESPPSGVTVSGDPYYDPNGGTITFTDYENSTYSGIIVNGSLNLKISASGDIITATITGTLTFTGTGAPAGTVSFDMTITIDVSDYYNPVVTASGTFSIDGEEFNASGIGDVILYYFY